MVVVTANDGKRKIQKQEEVRSFLGSIGIRYENWKPDRIDGDTATQEEILEAYSREIEELKKEGGYTTADVIDMRPDTPGLDGMLEKFRREHTHSEDEVRYTILGRGIFHVHTENGDVVSIEVHEGDLIAIPRGTRHWFNLCAERRIRAIRLFQDTSGWTPFYTNSGKDSSYQPVCMGQYYFPASNIRR